MKTKKLPRNLINKLIFILIAGFLAFIQTQEVFAGELTKNQTTTIKNYFDGDDPPPSDGDGFEVALTEGGVLDMNLVTYTGEANEDYDWSTVDTWFGEADLHVRMDTYVINSTGETIIQLDPISYMIMLATGDNAGNPINGATEAMVNLIASGMEGNTNTVETYFDNQSWFWDSQDMVNSIIAGNENLTSWITPAQWTDMFHRLKDEGKYQPIFLIIPACREDLNCTPELLAQLQEEWENPIPEEEEVVVITQCPNPKVDFADVYVGSIAPKGEGGKIYPNFPIVVGQDPENTGVDIQANVTIPPIIYTWWEAIPRYELRCVRSGPNEVGAGCTSSTVSTAQIEKIGSPEWKEVRYTFWDCIEHVEVYADALAWVNIGIHLDQVSQDYINGHLAEVYPGMRVYQAGFNFSKPGPGSDISGSNYYWEGLEEKVQIKDPGLWHVVITGRTQGTLVSTPRNFSLGLGSFTVEVIRTTLVP